MSRIDLFGVVGLVLIVLMMVLWIVMTVHTRRSPCPKAMEDDQPPRGQVSGGVMRGDPGQVILTGEAETYDAKPHEEQRGKTRETSGNGPPDR
jgi:hypothetical protein